MSGSPTRPSRNDFGPTFVDTRVVRDPAREPGQALMNLLTHQAAGSGLMVPRAWVLASIVAGPDVALVAHAEAWNPNAVQVPPFDPPIITRNGLGLYDIDYESSYPNQDGDDTPVAPLFAIVQPDIPPGGGGNLLFFPTVRLTGGAPPAGKFRYEIAMFAWDRGAPANWVLDDQGFKFLLW